MFGLHVLAAVVVPDDVVETVAGALGQPTWDTGWQPMPAEFDCTGNDSYRTVWWSDVRMTFERTPIGAILSAWSVGDPAASPLAPVGPLPTTTDSPSGLSTQDGIGVGTPAAQATSTLRDRVYSSSADYIVVLSGPLATSFPKSAPELPLGATSR
jgi:hypothetical protein